MEIKSVSYSTIWINKHSQCVKETIQLTFFYQDYKPNCFHGMQELKNKLLNQFLGLKKNQQKIYDFLLYVLNVMNFFGLYQSSNEKLSSMCTKVGYY